MFRIRFQGLITHARLSDGWVSVIYNEPNHLPLLTVQKGDWNPDETTLEPLDGANVNCFEIGGLLRLQNVLPGPVRANINGVPSLKELSDGDEPRNEILHRQTNNYFAGYFEPDGGLLSIEDWFEYNVTFDGATLRCLPRTVLFATEATASSVRLNVGQHDYVTLQPYAEVTISNLDTTGPTNGEYQFYKNFFKNVTTLRSPVESRIFCPYGSGDITETCHASGTLGVECSNNQFP